MRKFAAGAVIVLVSLSVAIADEFRATITKVDGNKITLTKTKKGEKGEEMILTAADNVKVVKGKFNQDTKKYDAGDAIQGGLKAEVFAKIGEKGIQATVVTEGDKITEIRVGGGGKKKKGG